MAAPSARAPSGATRQDCDRRLGSGSTVPAALQLHRTPFSAIASLLDTCVLAERAGPAAAGWDCRDGPSGPLLLFEHNSNGMRWEDLSHSLGLPEGHSSAATSGGGAGGDLRLSPLALAALRLGSCAMVLTKRLEEGKVLPSVGVGVVSYELNAPGGTVAALLYCAPDQSLEDASGALSPEQHHSAFASAGHASWDDIQRELDAMPAQGTKFLISRLWQRQAGGLELDLSSDSADILSHPEDASASLAADGAERGDAGVERCLAHRTSLRQYCSILYRPWPQGLTITVRGAPVHPVDIRDWMKGCTREEYRPRGIKGDFDAHGAQMQHVVSVHVGFLQDAPHTSMQGFCVYHRGRLIKPFWRVCNKEAAGRGIIGLLEVNFIAPTPDWQDLSRTDALLRLEAFLKRCTVSYGKKHSAPAGHVSSLAMSAHLGSLAAAHQQQQAQVEASRLVPHWLGAAGAMQQHMQAPAAQPAASLPAHLVPRQHSGSLLEQQGWRMGQLGPHAPLGPPALAANRPLVDAFNPGWRGHAMAPPTSAAAAWVGHPGSMAGFQSGPIPIAAATSAGGVHGGFAGQQAFPACPPMMLPAPVGLPLGLAGAGPALADAWPAAAAGPGGQLPQQHIGGLLSQRPTAQQPPSQQQQQASQHQQRSQQQQQQPSHQQQPSQPQQARQPPHCQQATPQAQQEQQEQQAQQQQEGPGREEDASMVQLALELAGVLDTLACQPEHLSKVVEVLAQQAQQAEQAGRPSSAAPLRRAQSVLRLLAVDPSLPDTPQLPGEPPLVGGAEQQTMRHASSSVPAAAPMSAALPAPVPALQQAEQSGGSSSMVAEGAAPADGVEGRSSGSFEHTSAQQPSLPVSSTGGIPASSNSRVPPCRLRDLAAAALFLTDKVHAAGGVGSSGAAGLPRAKRQRTS